jgi:hypothetical protein
MRTFIPCSIIVFALCACNSTEPALPPVEVPAARLELFDTTGLPRNQFRVNEDFDVRLSLTNNTNRPQIYEFIDIPAVFTIYRSDSAIATSIDGMFWIWEHYTDTLEANGVFVYTWRAPNPLLYRTRHTLAPGTYKVGSKHAHFFIGDSVPQANRVSLTVVP